MSEIEYCTTLIYAGTLESPPEYCAEEAEPGHDVCPGHREYESPFDTADELYESMRDSEWLS